MPTLLTEGTSLALNFDPTKMFEYTNSITTALMPIVYISAGLTN